MFRLIHRLKNHCIICGAGKVGSHVIASYVRAKKPFVAIDLDEKIIAGYKQNEGLNQYFLKGDASQEELLIEAGIESAKGLISCVRYDAVNLFICLTAKNLNPRLKISSYVINEINLKKFRAVGVDEVILGDFVIGERLTTAMLNENVTAFLERTNKLGGKSFIVGDVTVPVSSRFVGATIRTADFFRVLGILIFAVKKNNAVEFTFNPSADTVLEPDDVLITFATPEKVRELEEYLKSRG